MTSIEAGRGTMTKPLQPFFLVVLCLLLGACASEPAPVGIAPDVPGIQLKQHAPTQWSVWLDLKEDKLQRQVDKDLCWAAAVRVIRLHTLGESPEQKELYEQFVWTLPDNDRKAGYENEILDAMAGGYREAYNQRYVIDLVNHANLSDRDIILSLSAGEPVLVGFGSLDPTKPGHVCVLYGVKYEQVDKTFIERSWDSVRSVGLDAVDLANSLIEDDTQQQEEGGVEKSAARIGAIADEVGGRQYQIVTAYFWDPWNETFNAGRDLKGGLKSLTGQGFAEQTRFAISQVTAKAVSDERLEWLETHGQQGIGVYVRHPATRNDEPIGEYDEEAFDPKTLNSLMAQFGLSTQAERETTEPLLPKQGDRPAP